MSLPQILWERRHCMKKLGIEPQLITFTRRLDDDKGSARPLLDGLQSEQTGSDLLSRAKTLQKSSSEAVRRNVYINRNLSKEEARLAKDLLTLGAAPLRRGCPAPRGAAAVNVLINNASKHSDRAEKWQTNNETMISRT